MYSVLGASIAFVVAVSAMPYAMANEDVSAELSDIIAELTDVRNSQLVEMYFGDSYSSPESAAKGTVSNAMALFDAMGDAAFDAINSMNSNDEHYPFVLHAGSFEVVAEGAYPNTVGLPAIFLVETGMSRDYIVDYLFTNDGMWVEYVFFNPGTLAYEPKHAWLSLQGKYIFGSGYYESPDDAVVDTIDGMIEMYMADGEDSFTDIGSVAQPAALVTPYVLDATTFEIISHQDESRIGVSLYDTLDASWSVDLIVDMLKMQDDGVWVSYPSADPKPGAEYVKALLRMHDGYVFGSYYDISAEKRIQSYTEEAINVYNLYGDDAFDIVSTQSSFRFIVDALTNNLVASGVYSQGTGLSLGNLGLGLSEVGQLGPYLRNNPGLWADRLSTDPETGELQRRSTWVSLHDRYLFIESGTYSPADATVSEVNAAIQLYKEYGEKAFDHITWKSVYPRVIYPFVIDAETWQTVAHGTLPHFVGECCSVDIAADNDPDTVRMELEQNDGTWVEYTFYNPVTERDEYKRVYLSTYDGYTFGSGYYLGNFDDQKKDISDAISLYDTGREAAFETINAKTYDALKTLFVVEYDTLNIVAFDGQPRLAGEHISTVLAIGDTYWNLISEKLENDGVAFVTYADVNLNTGDIVTKIAMLQVHDGHIFVADRLLPKYLR